MKQRRLIVLSGGILILLLIWMFFHQGEDDVLQSHEITGVIKEFHTKSPPQKSTTPGRQAGQITIAVVALNADGIAEGGYARILVPRDKYATGDVLPLILKLYKNGSKKVVLAPKSTPQTQRGDLQ